MTSLVKKMSFGLLLTEEHIEVLIRRAPYRYKVYSINKKTRTGTRTIAQPSREIKSLQYWVIDNILSHLPIHESATAYRKGLNIRHNANIHCDSAYLLKMDFREFFPSIKKRDLELYFEASRFGLDESEIKQLCNILLWCPKYTADLQLSIGAPSSPVVSNIIMNRFDEEVQMFCEGCNVKYTRYADDLTFSTRDKDILKKVEEFIHALCDKMESPKLVINENKRVNTSKKHRRRITGLIISNEGKVSLGRSRKRVIRSSVQHYIAGDMDNKQKLVLAGTIAFAMSIEPDFIERLKNKYGDNVIQEILSNKLNN